MQPNNHTIPSSSMQPNNYTIPSSSLPPDPRQFPSFDWSHPPVTPTRTGGLSSVLYANSLENTPVSLSPLRPFSPIHSALLSPSTRELYGWGDEPPFRQIGETSIGRSLCPGSSCSQPVENSAVYCERCANSIATMASQQLQWSWGESPMSPIAPLLPPFMDTPGASSSLSTSGGDGGACTEANDVPTADRRSLDMTETSGGEARTRVDQDVLFAASIPLPDQDSDEEEAEDSNSEAISVPAASSSSPWSGFQHPDTPDWLWASELSVASLVARVVVDGKLARPPRIGTVAALFPVNQRPISLPNGRLQCNAGARITGGRWEVWSCGRQTCGETSDMSRHIREKHLGGERQEDWLKRQRAAGTGQSKKRKRSAKAASKKHGTKRSREDEEDDEFAPKRAHLE